MKKRFCCFVRNENGRPLTGSFAERKSRFFTLIELLVVIAIITILPVQNF